MNEHALSERDVLSISLLSRAECVVDDDASEEERALFGGPPPQLKGWCRLARQQRPGLWRTISKLNDEDFESFTLRWLEKAIRHLERANGYSLNEDAQRTVANYKYDVDLIERRRALPPRGILRFRYREPEERIPAPLAASPAVSAAEELPEPILDLETTPVRPASPAIDRPRAAKPSAESANGFFVCGKSFGVSNIQRLDGELSDPRNRGYGR